jgi:hypothetical protein
LHNLPSRDLYASALGPDTVYVSKWLSKNKQRGAGKGEAMVGVALAELGRASDGRASDDCKRARNHAIYGVLGVQQRAAVVLFTIGEVFASSVGPPASYCHANKGRRCPEMPHGLTAHCALGLVPIMPLLPAIQKAGFQVSAQFEWHPLRP